MKAVWRSIKEWPDDDMAWFVPLCIAAMLAIVIPIGLAIVRDLAAK